MVDDFIKSGNIAPIIKFSVTKFTRFTKNIDAPVVEYYLNLEGKISITDTTLPRHVHHKHNFSLHLLRQTDDLDLTNWNKFRVLEFADSEEKCYFSGSLLLKHNSTELGNLLDQAVMTGASVEIALEVDRTLKSDATSRYLDILSLHSVSRWNRLEP